MTAAGGLIRISAPVIGGVRCGTEGLHRVDHRIGGAPSVLFDAAAILPRLASLVTYRAAIACLTDASVQCKFNGLTETAAPLAAVCGLDGAKNAPLYTPPPPCSKGSSWPRPIGAAPAAERGVGLCPRGVLGVGLGHRGGVAGGAFPDLFQRDLRHYDPTQHCGQLSWRSAPGRRASDRAPAWRIGNRTARCRVEWVSSQPPKGDPAMGILWTIIIGFVAGVVAKFVVPGTHEPSGFVLTTILGIFGAIVASYLGQSLGWYGPGEGAGVIGAAVGAIIVLFAWGIMQKRA